ncbi:MAG: RnfABCDGE type electron transport complex subunit D [Gammaproteobacteria bacterium]|nr:RnfABCDGE type electron transport complex subunit D [Gammaproteobacteria bacterium]MCP4088338.1 RnfABCDGE type electron transport complex subunit D [Gammaproteobacteria bacterium]MCP4275450.1 RnfABCDGE type electron transport complex subunit D [Gammaproteobacteria bacterium]MCP4830998.1 RnfABCDGE type electron transport complex subunit D [Gammaproteobacteria bacterium]MCP4927481.1 RnfABCDGE type electron transport complex subunit D [Gammaproteobacteria bacterium]
MSLFTGPLIHSGKTNRMMMTLVLVSLTPALIAAVLHYGFTAALLVICALAGTWLTELVLDRQHAFDGSALVTGLLFALLLPVSAPWWLAFLGGVLATGLGKHAFGGLGCNLFNPAALSRVILMALIPGAWFVSTAVTMDGITTASPLARESSMLAPTLAELLSGSTPGTLGQAAPLAVLAGGLLLASLRTIDWRIPLTFLAAVAFLALLLPASERIAGHAPWLLGNPLIHIIGGGTLLAAFFMLTDPVTAPFAPVGRIIFAIIAALAMMLIRYYTPYPDGAVLAILIANACVPLIDRFTLELGAAPRIKTPQSF